MADALGDIRIHNGTLSPETIDDGEYIFGHLESDAFMDEQVTRHALEVMTKVEQAVFPIRVGRKAISDQDIFKRYKEKLLQAQKEGNKVMFKQTMQAFVIRSTLLQA